MSNASSNTLKPAAPAPAAEADERPPAQYRAVTWGPIGGLLMVLVAFVVSQFVGYVLVSGVAGALYHTHSAATDWISSTAGQFVFVLAAEGLALAILWLFLKVLLRKRHTTWASLGFTRWPK